MINPQLLDYIKQQQAQGIGKDIIQNSLTKTGWKLIDINEAFQNISSNQSSQGSNVATGTLATPSTNANVSVKYAGFWIRFVALMVDSLILSIPTFIIAFIWGIFLGTSGFKPAAGSVLISFSGNIISLIIHWSYFSLMTYYQGATLGKMLVGITVKSENFERLSFGSVILRETVGKIISGIILAIGYIMAGFDKNKQALHDKIAHSVVVYKDPAKPHSAGLVIGIIIAAIFPIIAIIGILSSIVFTSLSSTRKVAQDAQIRAVITQIRPGIEMYFEKNNTYSVAHDCSFGVFTDPFVMQSISSIKDKSSLVCYAEGTSYAVSAKLSSGQNYCVDNTGKTTYSSAVDNGAVAECEGTVKLK